MNNYLSTATRLLRGHEGVRGDLYCDKCGKPWKECSGKRELWLITDWPLPEVQLIGIKAAMKNEGICPGGNPTEGVGFNRYADGIPDPVIDFWLAYRLEHSNEKQVREWLGLMDCPTCRDSEPEGGCHDCHGAGCFDYFDLLSPNRKAALLDLAHWAYLPGGWKRLRYRIRNAAKDNGVEVTPEGVLIHNFKLAAREILWKDGSDESKGRSGIYKISPTRATELAAILETDELPAWATARSGRPSNGR